MKQKKLIVIGGSAAGAKAAAKARRIDQNAEITIIQKDPDLSMASCGYPYYVGDVFSDRNMLLCTPTGVVRDHDFFLITKAIDARTEVEVTSIDRKKHAVTCRHVASGKEEILEYDKLILATGAKAKKPPIPGLDLQGISTLLSMKDADYLREILDDEKIKKAVIVGGGLIGIETCEALQMAGVEVTIVENLPQLLPFLDWEMAKIVENHISSKDVRVIVNNGVSEFVGDNGQLTGVKLQDGEEIPCELAVMAIGVSPNAKLAFDAGLEVGLLGGVSVNLKMQTSDPDIYAAGDCVEVKNLLSDKKVFAPFGDLANLQGRVAGENAMNGNSAIFPGTVQSGICKIFEFAAGSTGLSEKTAHALEMFKIETVMNASPDKPGFMGAKLLISKMVVNKKDQRLIGYQCVGPGDVSKQVAVAAMAIQGKLTLSDLINADLPYAPPFSLAIDHFIVSAHIMQNKLSGRMIGISCQKVWEKVKWVGNDPTDATTEKDRPFLLDVRSPGEYKKSRLGLGETLMPLSTLRKSLHELPQDKEHEIICFCQLSLRGYEASLILMAAGWKNVKVMEGGIMAWPYEYEK
jgi:NADPH-dependent 2,4-dienoyl-CoA reductase/sulfur reductase-like enzyme/rhodanese-related sulfurtransferase